MEDKVLTDKEKIKFAIEKASNRMKNYSYRKCKLKQMQIVKQKKFKSMQIKCNGGKLSV